jgi:mercuric ion binding protein
MVSLLYFNFSIFYLIFHLKTLIMKPLKVYFTIIVAIFIISENAYSQHNHGGGGGTMENSHSNEMVMAMPARTMIVTETFKVWGNCEMCKARIEKAAKEEGVSSADWNIETKILTVSFDPAKTNLGAIEKKIADVGHDNEKYRADDKVYNALPECCKYKRAPLDLQAYYTCPMHSEVHSDTPGKCPKCGMELVKKEMSMPDSVKTQQGMEGMHHN